MAVPGQDERDWEFAEVFDLPIIRTVRAAGRVRRQAYTGDGPGDQQRASWTAWASPRPRRTMIAWLEAARRTATGATTYRLRDWLFSRQRYWGEPFPIVYDETGLPIAAARRRCCRSCCPRSTTSRRARSTPTTPTATPETPLSRAKEWVDGRAGPGRRPEALHPRDQHDAAVGRLVLVRPALPGPAQRRACWSTRRTRPTGWARSATATPAASTCTSAASSTPCCTCCTPASGTRCCSTWATSSSFEPFRRLFNQGYIQAYAYRDERGVYRAGRGGRRARRHVVPRAARGHPRVRQDGQVA